MRLTIAPPAWIRVHHCAMELCKGARRVEKHPAVSRRGCVSTTFCKHVCPCGSLSELVSTWRSVRLHQISEQTESLRVL